MRFNKKFVMNWKLLALYLAILSFLSLNPWLLPDSKQAIGAITWDFIDHFAAYALLSILMMSVFKLEKTSLKTTVFVILISSSIGILFECGQYWLTSTRQFSLFDALANVAGALLGVMIFWFFQFLHKRVFH